MNLQRFRDQTNHHAVPYTSDVSGNVNTFPLPRHGEMTALQRLHLRQQMEVFGLRTFDDKHTRNDNHSFHLV